MIGFSSNMEALARGPAATAPSQVVLDDIAAPISFVSVLEEMTDACQALRTGPDVEQVPLREGVLSPSEPVLEGIVDVLDAQSQDDVAVTAPRWAVAEPPVSEMPQMTSFLAQPDKAAVPLDALLDSELTESDDKAAQPADAVEIAQHEPPAEAQIVTIAATGPQDTSAEPLMPRAKPDAQVSVAVERRDTDMTTTRPDTPARPSDPPVTTEQARGAQTVPGAASTQASVPNLAEGATGNLQAALSAVATPNGPAGIVAPSGPAPQSGLTLGSALALQGNTWVAPVVAGPVVSLLDAAGGRMVIDIAPEELGRLTISLTVQGDSAVVRFQTETPEAARILAEAERQLASELARFGMVLAGQEATPDRKHSGGHTARQADTPGQSDDQLSAAGKPAVLTTLVNLIA